MNCKGYVVSRQDTNRNNTKCKLSVWHHYNTPCSTEHFLKCLLTAHLRLYTVDHTNHRKTVCILNVLDDVSIQLCTGTFWTFTANIRLHSFMSLNMLSVRHHYNYTTPVTPCSTEHFLKCFLTVTLRVNCLSHKQQENCLYSECTGWWCLNSAAV